jgi:steroid 5-alpha reductase family enzyme
MPSLVSACALAVLVYITALFLTALIRKDNSLADIAWGPGFILVGVLSFVRQPVHDPRALLAGGLVLAWGLRLLEKKYEGNLEFEAYARRTSAFIPWFPKK